MANIVEINPETIKNFSIRAIANIIKADWQKVYFGAKPYLSAMMCVENMNDAYGCEDGRTQVIYFLSNASTWRGATAKVVKAELNRRLKSR
jgi:hypothetical protein